MPEIVFDVAATLSGAGGNCMEIEKFIDNHTQTIAKGDYTPPEICVACGENHDAFKFYDIRNRQLRVLRPNIVKTLFTVLLRWQCPLCQAKFTDYPPFIVPHKRFVVPDMITRCDGYLADDEQSYAGAAAAEDGGDICYPDANNLCEQFFSKSTVWRFMEYLAKLMDRKHLPAGFKTAVKAIKIPAIVASKYRSQSRLFILQQCFAAIRGWSPTFPDFETAGPPV
jgi:hypothetical protein